MSNPAQAFVAHLEGLAEHDRGALAHLRRSLSHPPGAYPPVYPFVERFVGADRHADDPWRKGLYLTAALFALHPRHREGRTLAAAFGQVARDRDSGSIERRFIALLGAEGESLPPMLRQTVTLIETEGGPIDYGQLLDDLSRWFNPFAQEGRDRLRQRWARDFYRVLDHQGADVVDTDTLPLEMTP